MKMISKPYEFAGAGQLSLPDFQEEHSCLIY